MIRSFRASFYFMTFVCAALATLAQAAPLTGRVQLGRKDALLVAFADTMDDHMNEASQKTEESHDMNRAVIDLARVVFTQGWRTSVLLSQNTADTEAEFVALGFVRADWPARTFLPNGIRRESVKQAEIRDRVLRRLDEVIDSATLPETLLVYFDSHGAVPDDFGNPNVHRFGSKAFDENGQFLLNQRFAKLKGEGVKILFIENSCESGATARSPIARTPAS